MSEPTGRARRDAELLGALLGPGVPELGCEECFAELDRYVELELARREVDDLVPGMRAHLAGCPACAEEYRSLRDLLGADAGRGPR